jgi:iron-sulfur cluster assembly accessory protein
MTTNSSTDALDPVTITAAAESFMRRMTRLGGVEKSGGFRLEVRPGGCSGMTSEFSLEAAPRSSDHTLLVNGLRVFLPLESRLLLAGVTVDFVDTPTQTGLTFLDPKASCCSTPSTAPELIQIAPLNS